MAFTGDLEHLPIVDVIQLMNSTRKSGILAVRGRKGESQLVFKDGYIVSANHLNNSVRIGDVLIEMGLVSAGQIDQALLKQKADGEKRSPLAITLIEMGILGEQDAHRALQHLIEITIVEILTWKSGKFTLDHLRSVIDCEFRYYPEKMSHEVNVNTQSILMDALRVFDEKKRDGLIEEEQDEPESVSAAAEELISEDDLGLSEIDHLDAKIPKAFSGVVPFDPSAFQRNKITGLAADLSETDREKLVSMLAPHTKESSSGEGRAPMAAEAVLFIQDSLLLHGLDTLLASLGIQSVSVSSEAEMGRVLAEQTGKKAGWLIFDTPVKSGTLALNSGIRTVYLAPSGDVRNVLNAYKAGVRAVMPKPVATSMSAYIDEMILLLGFLPEYIRNYR